MRAALPAAVLAAVYLLVDPQTVDLAAHLYRADLFEREGFTIWNGNWYAGHHTPAYSVLFPPLAALLTPQVAGALSAVAAAWLFDRLLRGHYGEQRARWGALWFGVGSVTLLLTGRMTFAFGVALGLGALLAWQRGRIWTALALAVVCTLASPLAGLFVALAGAAHLLAARSREGAMVAAAALAPALVIALAFPEGGTEPFFLSAFLPVPLFAAGCLLLLPPEERTLRWAAVLLGLAGVAAFVVDTPVGGNAARLGALFGGPLAATVLIGGTRRLPPAALAAIFIALAFWQWSPAVRDVSDGLSDPAAEASFYEPLNDLLEERLDGPARVEVVFTHAHREAEAVARRFPLARGWQRQLDIRHNELFYEDDLDPREYERWLRELGVRWVALADAELDYSADEEAAIVRSQPSFLRPAGSRGEWRLYEVTGPAPLALGARLTRLGNDSARLEFERPGSAVVRVRWSRYWKAAGACVESAGEWTRVTAERPGAVELKMSFALSRVASGGRRCG
jgi:hypothetical protein